MTTYIESKLNPDGTYDHSEVIEAHKNGGIVQYSDFKGSWWPWFSEYYLGNIKYRAVIEDKPSYPQFFKQDSERFQNRLHEENRMKAAAVIEETHQKMIKRCDDETELCWLIRQKFLFGDDTITLTEAEVNEIFPGLLK